MRLAAVVLVLLALPLIAGEEKPAKPLGPVTKIDSGLIVGKHLGPNKDVRAFLGIPYAAPPVGDLRWRPPAPVAPWEGLRKCLDFGPACPQPGGFGRSGGHTGNQSEDCLTLNVWAPASKIGDEKHPVMVWIHGGGMVIGAGSLPFYRGEAFARRGVVLVTINYRLGPFGFLAHSALSAESEHKVSGNYGLLDQIAALRWVKRNAATFGGDPERVTIFGESAGAVSVCCLMVSPLAKGIFQRAIAQSGTAMEIRTPLRGADSAQAAGFRLAKKLGVAGGEDVAAALRAVPAERLLGVAQPAPVARQAERKHGPIVDGRVLPDVPAKLWATGKQHDVPLLIGANADDGGIFANALRLRTVGQYRGLLKLMFRSRADDVEDLFPVPLGRDDVSGDVRRLFTVRYFVAPSRRTARAMAKIESPAYLYHFSRVTPRAAKWNAGAAHGFEIPYVFGNLYEWLELGEIDHRLSRTMQDAWIRFAQTGDPNGEGRPKWLPHTAENDAHLEFGDMVAAGTGLLAEECDLMDELAAAER